MSRIDDPAYLDHIRTESARFREVLADCDPAARVPACPDWDAADLLWHLAEVQWFWAATIRGRPGTIEEAAVERPHRPEQYAELLETFDDFSHALVTELERADPADAAWHWGPAQTVGASYSRQAHEALIHRIDAEQTAGADTAPIDPALAADGVLEMLDLMRGGDLPDWAEFTSSGGHLAVELTDPARTLWVEPGRVRGTDPDSGTSYDEGHLLPVRAPRTPATTVVRGRAADVDIWLWNRWDDSGIEVSGDRSIYDAFRVAVSEPVV